MGRMVTDLASSGVQTFRLGADTPLVNTAKKVKGDTIRGNVYGWYVNNLDAAGAYLQFYDKAAPTVGTDAPKLSLWVPASGGIDEVLPWPLEFDNAIYVAATTTSQGGTSPSTGLVVNLFYF